MEIICKFVRQLVKAAERSKVNATMVKSRIQMKLFNRGDGNLHAATKTCNIEVCFSKG